MAGRVVLITGGSRGIGAAAARRFAAGGDTVVVNYCRSREKAEALAAEIGGWAVQADVSDPPQVGKMVDNVLDKFCQLDILVCNAGIAQQKLFGDLTDEDWRRMFAVNVDGMFYSIRAALPAATTTIDVTGRSRLLRFSFNHAVSPAIISLRIKKEPAGPLLPVSPGLY